MLGASGEQGELGRASGFDFEARAHLQPCCFSASLKVLNTVTWLYSSICGRVEGEHSDKQAARLLAWPGQSKRT